MYIQPRQAKRQKTEAAVSSSTVEEEGISFKDAISRGKASGNINISDEAAEVQVRVYTYAPSSTWVYMCVCMRVCMCTFQIDDIRSQSSLRCEMCAYRSSVFVGHSFMC